MTREQRHSSQPNSGEPTMGLKQRGQSVHMSYHATPSTWPVRTVAAPSQTVWAKDALVAAVDDSVRQVRRSAFGLTKRDQDLLTAFRNGQYLTGVIRFLEISQKCEDVTDATAFPEALRGFQVQHHPKAHVDVVDAFGAETHANGLANDAQYAFYAAPSESNRLRAIEALNRQLVETHRSLMALHRVGVMGRG